MLTKHPARKLNLLIPPNIWLGLLVFFYAWLFIKPLLVRILAEEHHRWLISDNWQDLIHTIGLIELPRLALGIGLMIMSAGLLWRARIAWILSLILLIFACVLDFYASKNHPVIFIFGVVLLFLLLKYWQIFNRSSFAASSMYAIVSVSWLMFYAVLGVLYLGEQFNPPVKDPVTALYFSIITMATVGYGDILPVNATARLFVVSIVIFGVTVFATAISALAGPVVGGNLKKFVAKRIQHSMRKNHVIICGSTPLAMNVVTGLLERGHHVTAIILQNDPHQFPAHTDIIVGDPTTLEVLKEAGLLDAQYILALREDDAENAFIILTAKELIGSGDVKTVSVVNQSMHLSKIQRVHPDIIFSPQMLGSEILTRTLTGETIDGNLITQLFFNDNKKSD